MNKRIQPWRWLVKILQLLVVLGIPFLRVHGESALRFDVPTLQFHVFGASIWMDEFFLILVAVLVLSFLIVFLTILLGRIWCGWLCPQTIVVEFTAFAERVRSRGMLPRAVAASAVLVISALLAADIIWFFVEPREFLHQLLTASLRPFVAWSWALLTAVTFLNFQFLRRTFCATICPYAKMQGALFDSRTLVIAADPGRMDECMHCDACVAVCPVGIDVRKGLQTECVSCAECVDACGARMGRRGKPSLIGYRFGAGPSSGGLVRRPLVLAGAITVLFAVLFAGLLVSRQPIDMDIAADPISPPVREANDGVANTFQLSLTNRSMSSEELLLSANGKEGRVLVIPSSVIMGKNEHRRVRIVLLAEGASRLQRTAEPVTIVAASRTRPGFRLERTAVMLPPW